MSGTFGLDAVGCSLGNQGLSKARGPAVESRRPAVNEDLDKRLRDRLFLTRLNRHLLRTRLRLETSVADRLKGDLQNVVAEARRLRRRAAWLLRGKKPIPKVTR
jgi:hypothetical protein